MTRKSLPEEIADELMTSGPGRHAARLQLRDSLERDLGGRCRESVIACVKRAIDRHTKRNNPKKDPKLADLLRQYDAAKRRAWYHSKVPTKVASKRAKYPSELRYQGAMRIVQALEHEIEMVTGEAPRPFNPRA